MEILAPTSTELTPSGNAGLSHLPSLDGLRGIAVLAVVAFHFDQNLLSGGFLGVSVFFTLSGFLISRLLLHEVAATGTISLLRFYDRRFRRLLPAASMTIIGTAIWVLAVGRRSLLPAGDVRASALWHFNWHELSKDVAYGAADSSALAHFWSLAIEEQFYFAYPVLLFGVAAIAGRSLRPVILSATVVAAVLAVTLDSYFNTFSRLFEILAGCAVAAIAVPNGGKFVRSIVTAASLAILGILMVLTELPSGGELPTVAIFLTAGTTVAIISVAGTSGRRSFLGHPVLRSIGTYSYSIYLWHWPVFVLVDNRLVQVLLTISLSLVSFHCVEQPIRRLRTAQ